MASLLIIGIIALTSLVAYFVGTWGFGLRRDRLTQATLEAATQRAQAFDCVRTAMT